MSVEDDPQEIRITDQMHRLDPSMATTRQMNKLSHLKPKRVPVGAVEPDSMDKDRYGDVTTQLAVSFIRNRHDYVPNDMDKVIEQMERILDVFVCQNRKYGDSWKNDGLGPKALFVASASKHHRLMQLLWETPRTEMDVGKVVETLRDQILYCLLTIVRIDLELGIDEADVQQEVDQT